MHMQQTKVEIPQCRYLHIVPKNGGGNFLTNLTKIFAKYPLEHRISEHVFVTADRTFFENHAQECKVFYFDMEEVDMINCFADRAEYVFVHGFFVSWRRILQIHSKHLSKIIWRTWGADLKTPDYYRVNALNRMYLTLCFKLFVKRVRRFRMVGVANLVDEIKLETLFGKGLKLWRIPYTDTEKSNALYEKYNNKPRTDTRLRVMVGHSGYSDDHHIELLEQLKAFWDEDIVISMIMSYGNADYIEKVRAYVTEHFGEDHPKVEWISEKMPYEEYLEYLLTTDVVLFDMVNSAALGNLAPLVYFNKKIYLNRAGDIKAAFDASGLLHGCCDEIAGQTFAEFSAPLLNTEENKRKLFAFRKEYSRDQWKMLLEKLDEETGEVGKE